MTCGAGCSTIHPVNMRDHGVKAMGGHILKAEMLLDTFMKKFYCPAHRTHNNLACRGPQIIAGKILARPSGRLRSSEHTNSPALRSAKSPRCVGRERPFVCVCSHSSLDESCAT